MIDTLARKPAPRARGQLETLGVRRWLQAVASLLLLVGVAPPLGAAQRFAAVAVSAESDLALAATDDGHLAALDTSSGELRATASLSVAPTHVAVTPDGARLAVLDTEHGITVWNASLEDLVHIDRFVRPESASLSWRLSGKVEFSPDGKRLLAVAGARGAGLFDAQGAWVAELPVDRRGAAATRFAWDPQSRWLAVVVGDELRLYAADSGDLKVTIAAGEDPRCVAVHPGGSRVATGHRDGHVRLWDAESGEQVATWKHADPMGFDPEQWVAWLAFDPTGKRLAFTSASGVFLGLIELDQDTAIRYSDYCDGRAGTPAAISWDRGGRSVWWSFATGGSQLHRMGVGGGPVAPSPLEVGDPPQFQGNGMGIVANRTTLVGFDGETGNERWRLTAGEVASVGQGFELLERGLSRRAISGIYPHLASFNGSNECGTGTLVPWADRLWWTTYAPHAPNGSDDRLYAMNEGRDLMAFGGSVGGTPANRLIHRESRQLFIGPHVIDEGGRVRTIPYTRMPGRPTGTARHLTEPASKVYTATMEEGLYEIDVESLEVTRLFVDTNGETEGPRMGLPGYHGKGLYSGQGVLVYANNGEYGRAARTDPRTSSGVLAEWSGGDAWSTVLRHQFTEVTGPGGILGSSDPEKDPLWSIGWDHRSLILMLRSAEDDQWHRFRLPKGSHSYDGAHGWNTEWPRIRDVGRAELLMTMHGTLWDFPRGFELRSTGGIRPLSNYLKVVGDFCRLGDKVVFGCDDAARSEFLNRRRAKGKIAGPAASQSNLWFVDPDDLDRVGPLVGHGAVFVDEEVAAGQWSDPFLFVGYDFRGVHLVNHGQEAVTFAFEVDGGSGSFETLRSEGLRGGQARFFPFRDAESGEWVRVAVDRAARVSVHFEMRDVRPEVAARPPIPVDHQLAPVGRPAWGGLLRAGGPGGGLQVLSTRVADGESRIVGYHELSMGLGLDPVPDGEGERTANWMVENVAIPRGVVSLDAASAFHVDDAGRRWRFPVGNAVYRERPELLDLQRTSREVTTERDLFQCAGTFFELPADNAGGFARMRPIATHEHFIQDYCSWRGLLAMTGVSPAGEVGGPAGQIVRSADAAVWIGAVDDLWSFGKPRGRGGPWSRTRVEANVPSDPYLMCGYDKKSVSLNHGAQEPVKLTLEVDITGDGHWVRYWSWRVAAGETGRHTFPEEFAAYWVRAVADRDCDATVEFVYE